MPDNIQVWQLRFAKELTNGEWQSLADLISQKFLNSRLKQDILATTSDEYGEVWQVIQSFAGEISGIPGQKLSLVSLTRVPERLILKAP